MSSLSRLRLLPSSATATTGSSVHLGVPRLHLSIPKTRIPPFSHPSITETDSSSPLFPPPSLLDYCHRRSPTASEIFFNMASSCFFAASFRHHVPCKFPPPSYPVSFAQTSNICQRSTHSATTAFLLSIYYSSGLVPAAWSTLFRPSFVQVSSPRLCTFIPVTCWRKPTCTPLSLLGVAYDSTQFFVPKE